MTPDDSEKIGRWAGRCTGLMILTVEQLLTGQELDLEKWRPAAEQYEELAALAAGDEALQAKLHDVGMLARLMTIADLPEADKLLDQIPKDSDFDLARLLAQTVLARRHVSVHGSAQPRTFADLAGCLYELSRFARDRETAGQGLRQTIEAYRSAVEGFARQDNVVEALKTATSFVGLANEVLVHFQIADYLEDALAWGERLIAAFPEPNPKIAVSMCVLANNLMNTCNQLARKSSNREPFLKKQLAIAEYGRKLSRRQHHDSDEPAPIQELQEAFVRSLIYGNLNLALGGDETLVEPAKAAWSYYQEYQQMVAAVDDPDAQQRCEELGYQIRQALRETGLDSVAVNSSDQFEEVNVDAATAQIESRRVQTRSIIERLESLSEDQQLRELDSTVAKTYEELESGLLAVIGEIGLNHHACRFLLAAGAIADGRLGELTVDAVFHWVLSPTQHHDEPPRGHRGQIRRRQEVPAINHFEEEITATACLDRLAQLAQSFRGSSEKSVFLRSLFRKHNEALLAALMPGSIKIHYSELRKQSADNDLAAILTRFPAGSREALWEEYRIQSEPTI